MGSLLGLLAAFFLAVGGLRAETIPPRPDKYFNDYAGVVSPSDAAAMNHELADYERESSNQILVAVFPFLDSPSSVEDYTARVAHAWQVGQAGRNNGAVLFVFIRDHKIYIQVGYGLEPVLTDATCFQIIQQEIKPRFRANNFAGGLQSAINAMMAATRGEYHGTGRTHAEQGSRGSTGVSVPFVFVWIGVLMLFGWISSLRRRNRVFGSRGYSGWNSPGTGVFFGGFGNSDRGGSSGGSSDSFSSGGGDFGGGGAGGSW